MAQIPEDLIAEIHQRLPVKSVIRFRCLSKSLCSIIDSPKFVNSHLHRSSENINRRKVILQHMSLKNEPRRFHVIDMNNGEEEDITLEKPSVDMWTEIYGNCNGLLLLYGGSCKFSLWNPSNREYMNLPGCPLKTPNDYRLIGLGLGYDDSTRDYKVVFMLSTPNENQVWILGMRLKIWRRIEDCPDSVGLCVGYGYFADGSLNWLGLCRPDILAFDVTKETFQVLPQLFSPIKPVLTDLHVLEGCLCISFSSIFLPRADIYIRKKNDGFDQFTWEQFCSIEEPRIFKILGFLKSRNKILLSHGRNKLASYDVEEKSCGNIEIDNGCNLSSRFPILCTESLEWV
ncbi:F-box protein CPR1-like [Euphorbia lathyris]|uniref:F-box protein CPR1-like n=1 Tax=Euphorbia lathyris TaxID=212925 RepID=UPI0033134E2F